nr:axial regulator YABBY 4 isoform X1 [Ipomoea batatas]
MSAMNPLLDLQDQLCYVKCGHCTTILLVSVPRSSLCTVVTVRCGHCTAILSVNMMMMTTSLVPFQFLASLDHHHHQLLRRDNEPPQLTTASSKEIKRLKASNPCMSHKQVFSAASKNWAHLRPSQHHESEGGSYGQEEINVQSVYSGTEQPFYVPSLVVDSCGEFNVVMTAYSR